MNAWLEFAGRLHPLILHLPIGIFALGILVELRGRFRPNDPWAPVARYALGWAAFTSILACISGWLLGGDYNSPLLEQHRWLGIATAFGMTLVWLTRCTPAARPVFRAASTLLTAGVLGVAAHHGGSMTHGEDFLTGALPPPFRRVDVHVAAARATDLVYDAVVAPSLAASCVKCHGPEKSKDGFRVDTYERLMAAKDGELVVAGNPDKSRLIVVAELPRSNEEAMPPPGKAEPLSKDQLAVIRWWVEQGAKKDTPVSAIPAELKPGLDAVLKQVGKPATSTSAKTASAPAVPPADAKAVAALAADGLLVQPLSQQDTLLAVECVNVGTNFNNEWLKRLSPIGSHVAWLDASRTTISTGALVSVMRFSNLARLHLANTRIGDQDIQPLTILRKLEMLNLTGTPVTDAAVDRIAGLRPLRRVYVWNTGMTTSGVARLRAARPDLLVEAGDTPPAVPRPVEPAATASPEAKPAST